MRKVFEKKEKVYSILSDKKCGILYGNISVSFCNSGTLSQEELVDIGNGIYDKKNVSSCAIFNAVNCSGKIMDLELIREI